MDQYRFTAEASRDPMPMLSSRIRNILEGFSPDYGRQTALVLGRLRALFGEPLYVTENLEEQYSYCVRVEGSDGGTVYLEVYRGSSGPAIGGGYGEASQKAADALAAYIQAASPADYDYEGYYLDGPSRVRMGVKNGEPYYDERPLDLPEKEMEALFKRLYGLDG